MTLIALYDACVLYPFALRDLLIQLAGTAAFRAIWSEQINQEWVRKLCQDYDDITPEKLAQTLAQMNRAVPDCLITGYEGLIPGLELPDPDDRHVLAAAICGKADIIVALNTKDFPKEYVKQFDIEVQHPDEFLANLTSLKPGIVCSSIQKIRARLRKPSFSAQGLLDRYEQCGLVQTVGILREYEDVL